MRGTFLLLLLALLFLGALWPKRQSVECFQNPPQPVGDQQVPSTSPDPPSDIQTIGDQGTYTKAEFGVTSEEGRNVQALKYDIDKSSKMEGFKLIAEFLAQTLKRIPKCSKEEPESLDGLSVFSKLRPSEDILFKQKATATKTVQAEVVLGFYPVSKVVSIKMETPLYISPQYIITSNNSQFSSKSGDSADLLAKFNEQRFLIEFLTRVDAANVDFIADKQTLLLYIYDLLLKNYEVVKVSEDMQNQSLFKISIYE